MKLGWIVLALASFGAGASLTDSTRETGQVFFWHSEQVLEASVIKTSTALATLDTSVQQTRYRF